MIHTILMRFTVEANDHGEAKMTLLDALNDARDALQTQYERSNDEALLDYREIIGTASHV